jgi:hypothetical protein
MMIMVISKFILGFLLIPTIIFLICLMEIYPKLKIIIPIMFWIILSIAMGFFVVKFC